MTKRSLSPQRQRLVELLQKINFGRIQWLKFEGGEPVFDPPPRTILEVKFGGESGPRPELSIEDFLLKTQVVELFEHFDRIQSGSIHELEVKHGMPFRMTLLAA
jgi:hypothetical protein